jgi:hypothetical protein
MQAAPGLAHCKQSKSCNNDNLLAPRQFLPRHCAVALQLVENTMTNYGLRDKLHRDTAPVPIHQPSATETDFRPLINFVPRHS